MRSIFPRSEECEFDPAPKNPGKKFTRSCFWRSSRGFDVVYSAWSARDLARDHYFNEASFTGIKPTGWRGSGGNAGLWWRRTTGPLPYKSSVLISRESYSVSVLASSAAGLDKAMAFLREPGVINEPSRFRLEAVG